MPAPSANGLVSYLGRTGTPSVADTEVFGAAMAWARKCLGLVASDPLTHLELDNVRAVYGYAADLAKLPRTQFGYFAAAEDGEDIATMVGDIGRRWVGQLTFGRRIGVPFA